MISDKVNFFLSLQDIEYLNVLLFKNQLLNFRGKNYVFFIVYCLDLKNLKKTKKAKKFLKMHLHFISMHLYQSWDFHLFTSSCVDNLLAFIQFTLITSYVCELSISSCLVFKIIKTIMSYKQQVHSVKGHTISNRNH